MYDKIASLIKSSLPAPHLFVTHIHVVTPYKWGSGWGDTPKETREEVFRCLLSIFRSEDGWSTHNPGIGSFSAPDVYKKDEHLYIHPMDISGEITPETLSYVCDELLALEPEYDGLVRLEGKYVGKGIYALSDEELAAFYKEHEKAFREVLADLLSEEKKPVTEWFVFDHYDGIRIPRREDYSSYSSEDFQYKLLLSVFRRMVEDGEVVDVEGEGYALK